MLVVLVALVVVFLVVVVLVVLVLVVHIQQGKISPWLLLGCKAGKKLLKSFTDEQLQMTARFINPEFWNAKFKSYPADLLFVQETAKEAKIE